MCKKKNHIWNLATCNCKNRKYLASVTEDSVITCDKIINKTNIVSTKSVPTSFNLAILTGASIYYHLIKQLVKKKHLPYHDASKFKEINIKDIL